MIPKPYDWDGILTNTYPIALIETPRKILFKILSDHILFACNKFGVFQNDNFSMLKGTSMQSPVFAVGSVIEDALEKNREIWLVLQDIQKAYDSVSWYYLKASLLQIKMSGRIENSGKMTSHFVAGAFVNDTIWVGNCQALIQYTLNIFSKFFDVNDISINNDKTVTIPINQDVKLSVAKAYSDVCFFVNVVLKKAITDKQFSYLVLTVLQPIISYWTQFSFVLLNLKACLLHDFSDAAFHHPLFYSLKTFEQIQSENKLAAVIFFSNALDILGCLFNYRFLDLQIMSWAPINLLQFPVRLHVSSVNNFLAGVVKVFLSNELSLANNLPNAFHSPGVFPISLGLKDALYFSFVCSLKHFGVVFADISNGAAVYFSAVDLSLGLRFGAIALALECVPFSYMITVHTDSQAAIDTCVSEMSAAVPDFCIKIKGHFGICDNKKADAMAGNTTCSQFSLLVGVQKCFLMAKDMVVFGNSWHFIQNLYRSICHAHWEVGLGCNIVPNALIGNINWRATSRV
ncbi:hypothetical protein G9A89_012483 [Geosiphon pyriformis]|nr:hypothetical protein G9A89_012483 [Geosiphon pyriformis]